MSSNVIDFFAFRQPQLGRSRRTVWVPESDYNRDMVNGTATPYWTGREVLCFLVANPKYRGPLPSSYIGSTENPFDYIEVKGFDGACIYRPATPPDCDVDAYDWDEFERTARRS